jgi:hypothetical protein
MNKRGREHLRKALDKNLSCYVLITCEGPFEDGHMPVEMTYHGEESLVSFLLQGAQLRIDQDDEEGVQCCKRTTTVRLIE